jgi:hypothetical protein
MMQKAEANTEQAKAIANNDWEKFKESIDRKYGIQLSDNANSAWGQLQSMFKGYTDAGLGQSGLMNEVMDKYLGDVRKSDQRMREEKATTEESQKRDYLLSSGSQAEIADFVKNNPDLAEKWGMVPSAEIKDWYSQENLKSLYPDMSDEEISKISNMVIGEDGNYRSSMYQNLYANKYDLGEQKSTYQQEKLYQQKLDEEKKAYAPFTQTNPLSSYQPSVPESKTPASITPTSAAPIKTNPIVTPSTSVVPAAKDYWPEFKSKNVGKDFSGYSSVIGGKEKDYVNIQNPGGSTLYGIKRDLNKEQEGMKKGYYSGDWNAFHKKVYNY